MRIVFEVLLLFVSLTLALAIVLALASEFIEFQKPSKRE